MYQQFRTHLLQACSMSFPGKASVSLENRHSKVDTGKEVSHFFGKNNRASIKHSSHMSTDCFTKDFFPKMRFIAAFAFLWFGQQTIINATKGKPLLIRLF